MMQRPCEEAQPGVRRLVLGALTLERNLALAPMAGVTSLPFRLIAREAGAALVFTETISARGLTMGARKTWSLVESAPEEGPLAVQLFGHDAAVLGEATRLLAQRGADLVDLNLGCPVRKFVRNGAGAALLRDPPRVAPLVAAMRRALPGGVLSVKMRLGWSADSITAPEVARIAEAEGADFVSVHGRTATQLYRGAVDRGRIGEVVAAVRIPVLANGDLTSPEEVLAMLGETGAAGVMIGRAALRDPWIFARVIEAGRGRPPSRRSPAERAALVERHMEMVVRHVRNPWRSVHLLKKYLCAYSSGMPGSSRFRERVNHARELEQLLEDATRFFREAA